MVAAPLSVVDRAPGLWVYEHLVALGIDGEALEFAAPLLGEDDFAVERSARLRARIALHSVTDALAKAPDTLEINVRHCAALGIFRTCLVEHMGINVADLERECELDRLFAAVVVRSEDWNAYKKALDALFPPDVRSLSEKGKGAASPDAGAGSRNAPSGGGFRPELLATFSRCRSGADENHLRAQRRKHGLSLDEMRRVARNACAVGVNRYLREDSLRVIARELRNGDYVPSRGPLPTPARGGGAFAEKAAKAKAKAKVKAKAKAKAAREPSSQPSSPARPTPSPRRKPILKPNRTLPASPARAKARKAPSGEKAPDEAEAAPAARRAGTRDPYDFGDEGDFGDAATRAFAALGAAAAAMEAEDEYYGGAVDDDAAEREAVRNATPIQKVMKSFGWRRGGGGVGSDRGADESGDEEEAVAPTQAAPDEGEEEGGGGGLFSRVGGWIGLGRSGGAKRKRPEDDEDEDGEGIATTASMRKRAKARASARQTRAGGGASSPAASPAASPGGAAIGGASRKRRKGPLGVSNRHSKRAAAEANVPTIPRKKRVMWTPEETAALEAGVRALEKEGRFDMGAVDMRDGTVNDKWRRIYDLHRDVFDVNGRTTMDLKDKWRNVVNARLKGAKAERPSLSRDAPEENAASPAAGSPSSWRRAMINLGLVKAPSAPLPNGDGDPKPPREPGVSNRHSALRKKLGFSDGTRKRAQPWLDEEVAALKAGVEKEGEGKWASILKANPDVFLDRSAVDLKDKWRNLKGRATRTARKRVNGLDAPLSERALALAAEAAAAAAAAAAGGETHSPSRTASDVDVLDEGDAPPRNEESDSEP